MLFHTINNMFCI